MTLVPDIFFSDPLIQSNLCLQCLKKKTAVSCVHNIFGLIVAVFRGSKGVILQYFTTKKNRLEKESEK